MATEKKLNISFYQKLKKLQDIMGGFPWEKDGINRYQSYKYITEKQYKNNFKSALKQVGLLWKMEQLEYQYIPNATESQHMVIAKFKGMLIDPETGEKEEYIFYGSGADNGDKALYKAITGGLKFFLASNFNVAEDMEPENDKNDMPKQEIPPTPEKREEIKEGLIDKDGPATKMQINSLKKALKLLRETDPNQEGFIAKIVEATEGFTKITKKQCEQLLIEIGELIETINAANEETAFKG